MISSMNLVGIIYPLDRCHGIVIEMLRELHDIRDANKVTLKCAGSHDRRLEDDSERERETEEKNKMQRDRERERERGGEKLRD